MTEVVSGQVSEGVIALFVLDCRPLGGPQFYFNSAEDFTRDVVWGGQTYQPLPMNTSGFEYTTRGSLPQPTVVISNLYGAGNLLLDTYKGLVGAGVLRTITLARFLDDGSSPDPNAYIARDQYTVAQKTSHTAVAIAFKLSSKMDQEGTKLPRRQVLRDICSHSYRYWDADAGVFVYTQATCPYTGGSYFNVDNLPTSAAGDVCSRTFGGCVARFGTLPLPARFFPGVGRIK